MLKFFRSAALIAAILIPSLAHAQYGLTTKNLGGGNRTRTMFFYNLADYTANSSPGAQTHGCFGSAAKLGSEGCVAKRKCGNAATSCDATETSSSASSQPEVSDIYPPRRLWVAIDDAAWAASTYPNCTAVTLYGFDPANNAVSESFTNINQVGQKSKYAYQRVTRLYGTGCTNIGATDKLFAQATQDVAFEGDKVTSVKDIVSICSISTNQLCLGSKQLDVFETSTPWLNPTAGTIDLKQVHTDTNSAAPVNLALSTANTPVWITWRLP